MNPLTERQRAVLRFIETYHDRFGTAPTYREIMDSFAFSSPTAVEAHVKALVKKRVLMRHRGKLVPFSFLAKQKIVDAALVYAAVLTKGAKEVVLSAVAEYERARA